MDKFREVVMGLVRHAATFFAGYLVSSGLLDASQTEMLVGAVVGLGGVAWSIWAKAKPST